VDRVNDKYIFGFGLSYAKPAHAVRK